MHLINLCLAYVFEVQIDYALRLSSDSKCLVLFPSSGDHKRSRIYRLFPLALESYIRFGFCLLLFDSVLAITFTQYYPGGRILTVAILFVSGKETMPFNGKAQGISIFIWLQFDFVY